MLLPDVNVLIYAYREGAPDHQRFKAWLDEVVNGDEAYGMSDLVLSGFLRILTNPRIFSPPAHRSTLLAFADAIRNAPNCIRVEPGLRHWDIFTRLCRDVEARGNLVADAYLAALAVESGCEWVTTDRDYSRFPGLRWRHPLQ